MMEDGSMACNLVLSTGLIDPKPTSSQQLKADKEKEIAETANVDAHFFADQTIQQGMIEQQLRKAAEEEARQMRQQEQLQPVVAGQQRLQLRTTTTTTTYNYNYNYSLERKVATRQRVENH